MAYCPNCGNSVDDRCVVCPHCGVQIKQLQQTEDDNGGCGWNILGFFIPLVGLILYLVWKNSKPKTAGAVGVGALIGVVVEILGYVIIFAGS